MPRSVPEPRARKGAGIRLAPICVRVDRRRRAEWEAGLEPGETLSSMIRQSVEAELARRREERELAARRRAADRFGLDAVLEQARR